VDRRNRKFDYDWSFGPRFKRGKDTSATLSKSVIETLLQQLDTMV
jgi:hypothetical protein